ncbi:hypothetical protein Golax_008247 [Gossypium laxum]|uniref:Transmembrane protein n=1 Tax=Gossypium laxum TaxID=34288 RepID=A0A7J9AAT7_9ROSI|nr:hypothetical protein [Gossypium laxum]
MSAAFQEDKGSFLWVLAPIALISSLILPQFFFSSAIEAFFKDDTLVGILFQLYLFLLYILFTTIENCVLFFLGLGVFLLVTDHVQRPYLQFSAKRWGLITGLRIHIHPKDQIRLLTTLQLILQVYRLYQLTRAIQFIQNFTFLDERLSENPGNVQARRCNCWDGNHFPGPSRGLPLVVDGISPTAFSF